MFEIDKAKFGAFVSQLRKEKGYTQKDLAQKLFISDKAVSKWETGASIPDTTLLIPLSEILGVTATELLLSERMGQNKAIDAEQVESLVKQTLTYSAEEQTRTYRRKRRWILLYDIFLVAACAELLILYLSGNLATTAITVGILGIIFGGYFCLFAKEQLPAYYDENKISAYSDGFFRMNIPGVRFNNSNWPHILNVGRIWSIISMVGYPALCFALKFLFPAQWPQLELGICLALCLGGLFVPIYIVGKKHE